MAKKKPADKTPEDDGSVVSPIQRGVVDQGISSEMREAYLNYAMSVITSRALPDVRDGLKPVHRRILYAMHNSNLTPGAKTRKSATVVGDVIGKYHPHGDSAVYDSMVGLAQDFTMRYPLVIGQGNFGSIDGDPAAAYRYTEAKMSPIAMELLRDLEKNTVNFRPNFDNTHKEPVVLPAALPNLLLNGTLGIAVGMATNIPPHNMRELIAATIHLIDNPKATTEDLLQFVQGPDFPTGCIAFNQKDIAHAYATGRGGVVVRGEAEIVESKKGVSQIIITSIPYRVNKSTLIERIADLVHDKKLDGIKGLRDESTKDIRVVIDLKGTSHPQSVLNYLYKHTQLEETFHYNMVALVDGVPKTLSLKAMLESYVSHRIEVVTRRTQFDLDKALAREHILLGLKKALDHIDKIIALIRKSKDVPTAHAALMKEFKFSDIQATAILEMRLQKLAGLERKKIEDELAEVQALIKDLQALLASKAKLMTVIKKELQEAGDKHGDDRRTKIAKRANKELSVEDLVPNDEGRCPIHPDRDIERINEENYFFALSKAAPLVEQLYQEKPELVIPAFRFNEMKAFLARGLEDFSISRLKSKMSWGVPVPDDENHVMYVWFDALTNYISTLGWPEDAKGDYKKFWKEGIKVQYCGKDNVRQQSMMWQAMLLAAGLPTTDHIIINGFINSGGQKMSKSLGNVLSPTEIIDIFTPVAGDLASDVLRYYLLRHVNSFEDSMPTT
jgi:DNA gyrase subunit A